MKKTSKKMWSIVLAFVIALTMIPLSAFAEDYEIWVGGTQITDANQDDVLGDGKVSYNPQAGILTLNGATINGAAIEGDDDTAGIYSQIDLKIKLIGHNTITGTEAEGSSLGIWVIDSENGHDLDIFGEGSLTITAGKSTVEGHSRAIEVKNPNSF